MKAGLVGYGFSGQVFHAPFLEQLPDIVFHSVKSSKPEMVKKDYPNVKVFSGALDDFFSDSALDVVILTGPNSTHYEHAKKALQANLHVVLEKPFVIDSAEGKELIALAAEKNRILTVFHNRRWDNDFLTLKKTLEQKKIGEVFHYEVHFDRFRPQLAPESQRGWREQSDAPGSGVLLDLGSHLVDQFLQLFGRPDSLWCDCFAQRTGAKADDYFHLVLKKGKLRGILHASCVVAEPGNRIQVHGDKGSWVSRGLDPQEQALKNGIAINTDSWGQSPAEDNATLYLKPSGSDDFGPHQSPKIPGDYSSFYRQLARAVKEKSAPPVSPESALEVIQILELAKESAKSGKLVNC